MNRWDRFWIEWDAAGDDGPVAGGGDDLLWVALALGVATLMLPLWIWCQS